MQGAQSKRKSECEQDIDKLFLFAETQDLIFWSYPTWIEVDTPLKVAFVITDIESKCHFRLFLAFKNHEGLNAVGSSLIKAISPKYRESSLFFYFDDFSNQYILEHTRPSILLLAVAKLLPLT